MDKSELKPNKEAQIKCFLNCDYKNSIKVKKLGAKWHQDWRMWYLEEGMDRVPFKKWIFI